LGAELWRSNGNPAGTLLVRDINTGPGSSNPTMQAHPLQERRYLILNQVLFFGADDGLFGGELWNTNGTTAGTTLVKDINPGAPSSLVNNQLIGVVFRHRIHEDRIYFAANDGDTIHGNELWRTDGTNPGTLLDADINVGPDPSDPASFEIAAGDLFFAADDGLFGRELWRRDLP
jgi:ELWxxDGT repeat protein